MAALVGMRSQNHADRLYDASGSITSGGTAQLILPVAHVRSSLIIMNTSSANLLFEFGSARAGLATLSSGAVSSVAMTGTNANVGFGYSIAPGVVFYGGALGPRGNPQAYPTYALQSLPDMASPNHVAKAHCVMTGSAPNMTISSIAIDDPGSGYAFPPLVFLTNNQNDPFGAAVPSSTIGIVLVPNGSIYFNGSVCPTDQISVYGATTGQTYTCKYTL